MMHSLAQPNKIFQRVIISIIAMVIGYLLRVWQVQRYIEKQYKDFNKEHYLAPEDDE